MADGDILIGSADQSEGVAGDIIMGDASGGAVLDFTLPETTPGSVLLALIVHDDPIAKGESAATWTVDPLADGVGSGDFRLTILKRTSNRTTGANTGDRIRVFSEVEQEMTGCLVQVFGALEADVIEAISSAAFLTDDDPEAPSVDSTHRKNKILAVVATNADRTFTPPPGYEEEEDYFSTEFSDLSMMVAEKAAGAVGEIAPGRTTLSASASGRIWSVCLKYTPAGSSHASRVQPTPITNPSRHARKTP